MLLTEIFIELSHSHETTGKWNRVYKNRASRICGVKLLKNLRWHIEKTWEDHITSNFCKGCIPQILIGPFFVALPQMSDVKGKYLHKVTYKSTDSNSRDVVFTLTSTYILKKSIFKLSDQYTRTIAIVPLPFEWFLHQRCFTGS